MKFCIISPYSGLEMYAALSNTHLLLPQLWRDSEVYREFYTRMHKRGDTIILDNGAWEGLQNWSLLTKTWSSMLRDGISPHVVALPDYLMRPWETTWRSSLGYLGEWADVFPYEFMYIPQAQPGDIMGFCEGVFRALDCPRITWIGLSKSFPLRIAKSRSARGDIAMQIKRRRPDIKIHALGMMNGSLQELADLRACGAFESIDSNAPVWRGYCNYSLKDGKWPEIPVLYEAPWTVLVDPVIQINLQEVGVVRNTSAGAGS